MKYFSQIIQRMYSLLESVLNISEVEKEFLEYVRVLTLQNLNSIGLEYVVNNLANMKRMPVMVEDGTEAMKEALENALNLFVAEQLSPAAEKYELLDTDGVVHQKYWVHGWLKFSLITIDTLRLPSGVLNVPLTSEYRRKFIWCLSGRVLIDGTVLVPRNEAFIRHQGEDLLVQVPAGRITVLKIQYQ